MNLNTESEEFILNNLEKNKLFFYYNIPAFAIKNKIIIFLSSMTFKLNCILTRVSKY